MKFSSTKVILMMGLIYAIAARSTKMAGFAEFLSAHQKGVKPAAQTPNSTPSIGNPEFADVTIDAQLSLPLLAADSRQSVYVAMFTPEQNSLLAAAKLVAPPKISLFGTVFYQFTLAYLNPQNPNSLVKGAVVLNQNKNTFLTFRVNCNRMLDALFFIRTLRNKGNLTLKGAI